LDGDAFDCFSSLRFNAEINLKIRMAGDLKSSRLFEERELAAPWLEHEAQRELHLPRRNE
jgi:hypothetical protein